MLLNELQKIVEIDTRISDMHRELADLYVERSNIVDSGQTVSATNWATKEAPNDKQGNPATLKPKPLSEREQWARHQHHTLATAWQCYGITLPPFKRLKAKLLKAEEVMADLVVAMPALDGAMAVVAVPPGKLLDFPVSGKLRNLQGFSDGQDYVNQDLPQPAAKRDWRILVTYAAQDGLAFGLPKNILDTRHYLVGGYDTRALGAAEYAALSLQYDQPIDDGTWTLLLKNYKEGEFVPSAAFVDGRFRFDLDEADGGLDIDLYRPAVEI